MSVHSKVTAGALAGALIGILVSEADRRGYRLTGEEAADLTVLVSFIAGFFCPSSDADTAVALPPDQGIISPGKTTTDPSVVVNVPQTGETHA